MAILFTQVQQPIEILLREINYDKFLAGRVATSITPVVTAPLGQTTNATNLSGNKFQLWPMGGQDQNAYKWIVVTELVIGGFMERVKDTFYIVVTEQ